VGSIDPKEEGAEVLAEEAGLRTVRPEVDAVVLDPSLLLVDEHGIGLDGPS
jgi:hypothetical protein